MFANGLRLTAFQFQHSFGESLHRDVDSRWPHRHSLAGEGRGPSDVEADHRQTTGDRLDDGPWGLVMKRREDEDRSLVPHRRKHSLALEPTAEIHPAFKATLRCEAPQSPSVRTVTAYDQSPAWQFVECHDRKRYALQGQEASSEEHDASGLAATLGRKFFQKGIWKHHRFGLMALRKPAFRIVVLSEDQRRSPPRGTRQGIQISSASPDDRPQYFVEHAVSTKCRQES